MAKEEINVKPKKRGVPGRQTLYNAVGKHRVKILATLVDLLDSRNPNVRLGAAKALFNKLLPDLKATELSGELEIKAGVVILPSLNEATNNMETPQGTADGGSKKN